MPRTEPTLQNVIDFAALQGDFKSTAEKFFHHYEAQGWLTGSGQKIVRWQAKFVEWKLNKYRFEKSNMTPVPTAKDHKCRVCLKPAQMGTMGKWYCGAECRKKDLGW